MANNIIEGMLGKIALEEAANRDCLVARFVIENDLKAHEVELVSETTSTGYKFYVRKRQQNV